MYIINCVEPVCAPLLRFERAVHWFRTIIKFTATCCECLVWLSLLFLLYYYNNVTYNHRTPFPGSVYTSNEWRTMYLTFYFPKVKCGSAMATHEIVLHNCTSYITPRASVHYSWKSRIYSDKWKKKILKTFKYILMLSPIFPYSSSYSHFNNNIMYTAKADSELH